MGLGAEGGAAAGGAGASANTGEIAGLGPYASGGGGTGADLSGGAGSGGLLAGIRAFMSDPKNVQALGTVIRAGSSLQQATSKLPPDAQQFFRAAMSRAMTSSGSPGGVPGVGTMQPTQGPYRGDAGAYNIDPEIARSVLARMGIQ